MHSVGEPCIDDNLDWVFGTQVVDNQLVFEAIARDVICSCLEGINGTYLAIPDE